MLGCLGLNIVRDRVNTTKVKMSKMAAVMMRQTLRHLCLAIFDREMGDTLQI